jgi:hypothetical protein
MFNKKGILANLEGHSGPVQSVVFHPTAHLMATAGGVTITLNYGTQIRIDV